MGLHCGEVEHRTEADQTNSLACMLLGQMLATRLKFDSALLMMLLTTIMTCLHRQYNANDNNNNNINNYSCSCMASSRSIICSTSFDESHLFNFVSL